MSSGFMKKSKIIYNEMITKKNANYQILEKTGYTGLARRQ